MKILHVSDTHNSYPELPEADVLVHSGDMGIWGDIQEMHAGLEWLSKQKAPIKLFCPGNHDIFFDSFHIQGGDAEEVQALILNSEKEYGVSIYPEGAVEIEGLLFAFSSYQPNFMGWGFNVSHSEQLYSFREALRVNPDVLVTHCPQHGILDMASRSAGGVPVGSTALYEALFEHDQKPNNLILHLHGHVHEAYGFHKGKFHTVNSGTRHHIITVEDKKVVDIEGPYLNL